MIYFQSILNGLNTFWANQGCVVVPAYPAEVGAATFHPTTIFNSCANKLPNLRVAYVQPCIRPVDNRGGASKNRLYQHHQFQVLIKPIPSNIQNLYLESLSHVGLVVKDNDIKFVEDNWENPSIGAYGLGWEVQCNGMEITQFTYMQQVGGVTCPVVPVELAYGLERLAMLAQDCDSIYDIVWNETGVTYGDLFLEHERQFAASLSRNDDGGALYRELLSSETSAVYFINMGLPMVAFRFCLSASHALNMLDASGALGYNDRAEFMVRIKNLVREICELWSSES